MMAVVASGRKLAILGGIVKISLSKLARRTSAMLVGIMLCLTEEGSDVKSGRHVVLYAKRGCSSVGPALVIDSVGKIVVEEHLLCRHVKVV